MQFDDCFGDCQAHSCALDDHALVAATIEFLKNHLLFHVIDSRTVIRDACDHFRTSQFGSDVNRSPWWRILACIVQQMDYHLSDPLKIHSHWRETLRDVLFSRLRRSAWPELSISVTMAFRNRWYSKRKASRIELR